MIRLEMKNYTHAAKISALSPVKIDKYEYLTGEEIIPSDQKRVMEQAMFTYSLLENALEKALRKQEKQLKIKEKNK